MRRWQSLVVVAASVACFTDEGPSDTPQDTESGQSTGATAPTTSEPSTSTASTTTTGPTADASEGSSGSTGETECANEGGLDETCPTETPYCIESACRSCEELPADCVAIDPLLPICHAETGACSRCEAHDECGSGACRIATGECFPESNRLWVDAGADCRAADGSEGLPFCTVADAFATVDAQPGEDPWAVFVVGDTESYELDADATLPERPFALIGPKMGLAARLHGAAPRALGVYATGIDRYVARLTFVGEFAATSLECSSGDLWGEDLVFEQGELALSVSGCDARMRRVTIEGAQRGVHVGQAGSLTLDESALLSNAGAMLTEGTTTLRRTVVANSYTEGGVSVAAGSFSASNTVFHENAYAFGHIDVGPGAVATLDYVVALSRSLSCAGATSTYAIRNSIVDDITCTLGSVTVDQSLVALGSEGLGEGNVGFPPADYELVFVDYQTGDVHITVDPPEYLLGIAVRTQSDPAEDLDGDLRPDVGEPDYPGIDAAP